MEIKHLKYVRKQGTHSILGDTECSVPGDKTAVLYQGIRDML